MAIFHLEPFGLGNGGSEPHGDVVGHMVASQGQDGGVPDGPARKDRDVGGAAADVHQDDTQLFFVRGQDGTGRGNLLQDDVLQAETGLVGAFGDVADCGNAAGHDMDPDFQARTRHADRIGDATDIVDGKFLRQYMDYLNADRLGKILGLFHHPFLVGLGDLITLDGDDAVGADALNMTAGDTGVDIIHPDTGHLLSIFDRMSDSLNRILHVDHQAAFQTFGDGCSETDDFQISGFLEFGNQTTDFGCSDIQADDNSIPSCHMSYSSKRFYPHR